MALIEDRKGRDDGGYTRLFGDPLLGKLLSRVQGAVIASGTELERVVTEHANTIKDADTFLRMDVIPEGVFLVPKKVLRKSELLNYAGVEPILSFLSAKARNTIAILWNSRMATPLTPRRPLANVKACIDS